MEATSANLVRLGWTTAQERNARYFSVERSRDPNQLEEIARVAATGEEKETFTYIHTDETPLRGRSYYRLRQVDQDGSHTYSKIVSARTSGTGSPYPNPAPNGVIRIEAAKGAVLQLTDLSGRDIPFTMQRIGEQVTEIIPRQRLQSGVYLVIHDGLGYRVMVEGRDKSRP